MQNLKNVAATAGRLRASLRLYAGTCTAIWISKTYALYGNHDIWSQYSFLYVLAAAAVSSYTEIIITAFLAIAYYIGGRYIGKRRGRYFLDGAVLLALVFVVLVNYVNAELLAKLGVPLTLPLIKYSDVISSEHARDALWAWTDRGVLVLAVAIALAVSTMDIATRFILKHIHRTPLLVAVLLGTCAIAVAGITRKPAPANLSESGTLALLRSLRVAQSEVLSSKRPAQSPFSVNGREPGLARPAAPRRIRNVILVVLEAASAQYFDQYGGRFNVTPHLTARSAESIVVQRTYAQSTSSTLALTTLLSSRYPPVWPNAPMRTEPADQHAMLPKLLASAGVRTGFFHSSDTRFAGAANTLLESGFETVHDYRDRRCNGPLLKDKYSSLGNADWCTFSDMLRWIAMQPSRPFFATVWTFQSHYPYFTHLRRSPPVGSASVPGKRVRHELQRYLNAISEADYLIGHLITRLEELGRYDDTLIIVTADHGQAFGQHGTYGNGSSIYEESVRVPLILINRQLRPVRSFTRLSGQIDIAPTILDILGTKPPTIWEGVSLFRDAAERPVYSINTNGDIVLGYRFRNRKVISNLVRGTVEIYDLRRDPGERYNLSNVTSPNQLAREQAWLAAWASANNN